MKINKVEISKNIASSFIGAIGTISAIVSLGWPDIKNISIWWVNLTLTISLWAIIFIFMLHADIRNHNKKLEQENFELKERRLYEIPFQIFTEKILLIRNNEIFTNGIFVGIYHIIDHCEEIAFIGEIINAQTNKIFQVEIVVTMPNYDAFQINTNTLKNLMVRPSFPTKFLELLKND